MTSIAVLQMTAGIDPAANADVLERAIAEAAAAGAAMIFTPEMSGLIDRDRTRAAAHLTTEDRDPVLARVRAAAAEHGLWVHLGSLAMRVEDGRLANRGYVIDDRGDIRARYDKMHLFDVDLPSGESWRESAAYVPGDRAIVVDTPVGRLGLAICYDLRFPALFAALTEAGATILSVPAAFTRPTGGAHWHVLLRARAIEAGVHLVAAAQTGEHQDGRATYGHSLVVGPWGEVLLDMGEAAGLGFAAIDPTQVEAVRERLPAIRHRRAIPSVVRA
ncbi:MULTISPECIES: carbon-nitrogen hydrolase family protein [Sphingomonas]|jgi:deaminated glutathione amidase|uniref:Carbon-nitrogen hydrolase family protein n=1 Tax=Sphingomonas zeae TaxID=1646122 RepID=A0A7Y6B9Z6_9SPHN|nr:MULTISPECIES: carbon-nitrogen hydrolase family protein [Sphingomonas]MBB4047081.1 putative amidohydrolase [Sphingomonas zeae]MDK8186879.1 carbon-nitrogen hydrolase family protein [Sphingomonas zeae]MDK8214130.1 carbon-nitrogen hydrolase family protein [Sphingomonas sp. UMB7805-LC452B]NUU49187.1 carbon-nitrogen hydrolase family protein [Sphingomonas zeae]